MRFEYKYKLNLLEYREHYEGNDLKDIIDNFSNDTPKIFVVYSCHSISKTKYLEDSPELLTEQKKYGIQGPKGIPDFQLTEPVFSKNIQVIPVDGIPDNEEDKIDIQEDEIDIQEDEKLPQNKLKKKQSTEECETCNKSFCNIQ